VALIQIHRLFGSLGGHISTMFLRGLLCFSGSEADQNATIKASAPMSTAVCGRVVVADTPRCASISNSIVRGSSHSWYFRGDSAAAAAARISSSAGAGAATADDLFSSLLAREVPCFVSGALFKGIAYARCC
jgi:hypothetical protein